MHFEEGRGWVQKATFWNRFTEVGWGLPAKGIEPWVKQIDK